MSTEKRLPLEMTQAELMTIAKQRARLLLEFLESNMSMRYDSYTEAEMNTTRELMESFEDALDKIEAQS